MTVETQLGWIIALAVLACLSYLDDTGIVTFMHGIRVPVLHASLLSLLILLCMAGLLSRMLQMQRRGEKEALARQVETLQSQIQALRARSHQSKDEQ